MLWKDDENHVRGPCRVPANMPANTDMWIMQTERGDWLWHVECEADADEINEADPVRPDDPEEYGLSDGRLSLSGGEGLRADAEAAAEKAFSIAANLMQATLRVYARRDTWTPGTGADWTVFPNVGSRTL